MKQCAPVQCALELNFMSVGSQLPPRTLNILIDGFRENH